MLCAHIYALASAIDPGETTADGAITLLPIVCLGYCDHAPAMLLDDDVHGDLDAQRIDVLVDSLTKRGI